MHPGAHLITTSFPEFKAARKALSEIAPEDWKLTWPDGPFKTDGWRVICLVKDGKRTQFVAQHPDLGAVLDFFEDPIGSAVLYSMLPGAEVHPHRDLSGTIGLGGVKYHVALETNPEVSFSVGREEFSMRAGEFWALNTSYIHGVKNHGSTERIHLVVQVEVGEWSRRMLPARDLRFYFHNACFLCMIAWRAATKLILDRNALKTYSGMSRGLMRRLLRRPAI
jgi:quercetin dioxygenase-like cupin family protein